MPISKFYFRKPQYEALREYLAGEGKHVHTAAEAPTFELISSFYYNKATVVLVSKNSHNSFENCELKIAAQDSAKEESILSELETAILESEKQPRP